MSKSLGNLVFVDKLRTEWDPMAIRLGAHRAPLPHRVGVGRRADAAQRRAARGGGATAPTVDRAMCSTRSASASTTISTRPVRWPPSTPPRHGVRRRGLPPTCSAWSSTRLGDRSSATCGGVTTPGVHKEFNRTHTAASDACPTLPRHEHGSRCRRQLQRAHACDRRPGGQAAVDDRPRGLRAVCRPTARRSCARTTSASSTRRS